MASRAEIRAFQRSKRDLLTLVEADLAKFWRQVDTSTPEAARAQLDLFVPSLVQTYGESAALLAADYYDRLREQSGARGRYAARMAEPAPVDQIEGSTRWAVGPLSTADVAQALANMLQAAQRLVVQPARQTITLNVDGDPGRPKWARVPTGAKTCAFCLMLASRGAVYDTDRSAGRMHHYHADCDCEPTPIWEGDDFPDGYDPDALYERYNAARAVAGGDSKAILAELRQREGIA